MNLTCGQIIEIAQGARQNGFENWDLPLGMSLQLSRAISVVFREERVIEQERLKRLKKHATLNDQGEPESDEEGKAKFPSDEAFSLFTEEYQELMEEEVDIFIEPVKVDFDALNSISKKPQEILWLRHLIQERQQI